MSRICVLIFAAFPVVWSDSPVKLCSKMMQHVDWSWGQHPSWSAWAWSSFRRPIAIPTSSCPAASGGADPLLGRRVDLPLAVVIHGVWWGLMGIGGDSEDLEMPLKKKSSYMGYMCQPFQSSWAVQRQVHEISLDFHSFHQTHQIGLETENICAEPQYEYST